MASDPNTESVRLNTLAKSSGDVTAEKATAERRRGQKHEIPIVDEHLTIVSWSDEMPQIIGGSLRHRRAETILRGRVSCRFIEISDASDARRSGAPPDWQGSWRCLAIGPNMHEPNQTGAR